MQKNITIILFVLLITQYLGAQVHFTEAVSINTAGDAPETTSILDIQSDSCAVVMPSLTTAERDALDAVDGMIIYNTDTKKFQGYITELDTIKPIDIPVPGGSVGSNFVTTARYPIITIPSGVNGRILSVRLFYYFASTNTTAHSIKFSTETSTNCGGSASAVIGESQVVTPNSNGSRVTYIPTTDVYVSAGQVIHCWSSANTNARMGYYPVNLSGNLGTSENCTNAVFSSDPILTLTIETVSSSWVDLH